MKELKKSLYQLFILKAKVVSCIFAAACFLLPYAQAFAQQEKEACPSSNWYEDGKKTLEVKGLSFALPITMDTETNYRGGAKTGTAVMADWLPALDLDTEKAGLWSNGLARFSLLAVAGHPGSSFAGDLQIASNIEAEDGVRFYEVWYEHSLTPDNMSLRLGLLDLNTDFYTLQYASYLINSSFGIGAELSQIGPAIYPNTAFGLRLKAQPADDVYLLAGIYDGAPVDGDHPRSTRITLSERQGFLSMLEGGISPSPSKKDSPYYKLGLGAWYLNSDFENYQAEEESDNYGMYAIGEHDLLSLNDSGGVLGGFFQFGLVPADRNQTQLYWGAGLAATGFIPQREQDSLALAIAQARNGSDYKNDIPESTSAETALELNYQAQINNYFVLQPCLQWIINPGTSAANDNALVSIMRVQVLL